MQTTNFIIGLIASIILVIGSAYPEEKVTKPIQSVKNWLFLIGGFGMLIYAIIGYYVLGGNIFFMFLEIPVCIASILMMLDTDDRIDLSVISISSLIFIIWSLTLFKDYTTIFFILGLSMIALGYAFKMGTIRRSLVLTLGSLLIALFSYFEANWIFFWLNAFFAVFSAYYLMKDIFKKKK